MRFSARRSVRLRVGVASLLVMALLLPSGCGTAKHSAPTDSRVPVLVDTDMGADDVIALLYLSGRPDIDLVGVTVVGDGIVHCPAGGANALAVLAAAGRVDVPVACGSDRPSDGNAAPPEEWRARADALYGMATHWPAPSGSAAVSEDPVALIASLARAHPGLRILGLGPLTTVAAALRRDDVRAAHPKITVSGGTVGERGNMPTAGEGSPLVEFNIGIDPAAADAVLRSGLATDWVPLDATAETPIDIWFTRALAGQSRNRPGAAALSFLRTNVGMTHGGFYFWDPLTAVSMTERSVVSWRSMQLSVRTAGTEAGRTVTDPAGTPVTVAMHARPIAFTVAMLRAFRTRAAAPAYSPGVATVRVSLQGQAFRYTAPHTLPAGRTVIGFDAASGAGFTVIIGRLAAGHTYADVQRAIARGVRTSPSWFVGAARIDVPGGCKPTWLIDLPAGRQVFVGMHQDGTRVTAIGEVVVR